MKAIPTEIAGLILVEHPVFRDDRGFFLETFHEEKLRKLGVDCLFVQDNFSNSKKNVLRGLHFQKPPFEQDKFVRVTRGRVWDVAVDLRVKSPTYLKYFGVELSDSNGLSLFIPKGFAHGFCVLSDEADFYYKCSEVYHPEADAGFLWSDPKLKIEWPIQNPILSKKDAQLPCL